MSRAQLAARDLALIATFAALIAALGTAPPFYPVGGASPVTAQTLGIMLAGSILGARRGALAVVTFLALVAAGLPLLAGGRGGLEQFSGKSAGFLVGWVAGAWVIGALVALRPPKLLVGWLVVANAVGGIAVVYVFGVPWMAHVAGVSLLTAWKWSAVYLVGDSLKVAVAVVVTAGVIRGYPAVLPQRFVDRRREAVDAAAR